MWMTGMLICIILFLCRPILTLVVKIESFIPCFITKGKRYQLECEGGEVNKKSNKIRYRWLAGDYCRGLYIR
jgi:hypothetical protein